MSTIAKRDIAKDLAIAADNVKTLEPRYIAELMRSACDEIIKLRSYLDVCIAAGDAARQLRDKP